MDKVLEVGLFLESTLSSTRIGEHRNVNQCILKGHYHVYEPQRLSEVMNGQHGRDLGSDNGIDQLVMTSK